MKQPKKWKMAILIWIAIYPALTLLVVLIGEQIAQIGYIPIRTLIMTIILVPLMVFILLPILQKLLKNWLMK